MKLVSYMAGTAILFSGIYLNAAEVKKASVEGAWQSRGTVYMSDPNTAKFMGVLQGVMYVKQGDKEEIDALPFVCPSIETMNLENHTIVSSGDCMIGANNDIIYASYECAGPVGGCEGRFSLRGGTGKFAKISGASKLSSRLAASLFVVDAPTIIAQKSSEGVFLLPELVYRIPSK